MHTSLSFSVSLSLSLSSFSLCRPLSVHSLCVFLYSFIFWGLFCSDNNKFLQNSIALVLVPASVQGNRQIMTPQRRDSRSIHNTTPHSSSQRSTQAFTELGPRPCAGIVDNIPAAAPAAPPPRRSTHKFIHFYKHTSLYGAWQK